MRKFCLFRPTRNISQQTPQYPQIYPKLKLQQVQKMILYPQKFQQLQQMVPYPLNLQLPQKLPSSSTPVLLCQMISNKSKPKQLLEDDKDETEVPSISTSAARSVSPDKEQTDSFKSEALLSNQEKDSSTGQKDDLSNKTIEFALSENPTPAPNNLPSKVAHKITDSIMNSQALEIGIKSKFSPFASPTTKEKQSYTHYTG